MNITKLPLAAALALSLSACASTGTGPTVSTVTTAITNDMNLIKADVKLACGYVVPIADVAAIVATFLPGASLVGTVTTQICQAVLAMASRRGGALPEVNGIPLHGYFARAGSRRHHHP